VAGDRACPQCGCRCEADECICDVADCIEQVAYTISAEELAQLQAVLALGFLVALLALLGFVVWDSTWDAPAQPSWVVKAEDEECKLHSRKLSECKRRGYHTEDDDDSSG
jgi:hypothetical protein